MGFNQYLLIDQIDNPKNNLLVSAQTTTRADYSFTIICENDTHITNGGDPTGYYIDISNTGTQYDTIQLSWELISVTGGNEPDPKEWDAYLNKKQVNLAPGLGTVVILNVSTDCTCQVGTIATIRVTGVSVNRPEITGFIDTFTSRGAEKANVKLDVKNLSILSNLTAGQELNFNLGVKNPQSVKQSFKIRSTRNTGKWQLIFSDASFEVAPLSKIYFDVFLKMPLLNNPGEYKLGFEIVSDYDPLIRDSIEIPIMLLPELQIKNIIPSIKTPVIKEKVYFNVVVENAGAAVARNIIVHIYDHRDHTIDHLIWQNTIGQLNGSSTFTLNFSWTPNKSGRHNLTAYVDPSNYIEEASNRYFNNIKIHELTVKTSQPDTNGNPDDLTNQKGSEAISIEQLRVIFGLVIVVVVLIIIFLYFHRRKKYGLENEKTAKKLPIDDRSRNYNHNRSSSRHSRRGHGNKTARKIRIEESSNRGRKSGRRSKYNRSKTQNARNKKHSRRVR